jgi:arabinoxylan arabinofuranohydrolase
MTQIRTTSNIFTLSAWLLLATSVAANYETFQLRYSADPAPLVYEGRMYLYTSHDIVGQVGWLMRDYNCFSTIDGVNFRDDGIVFSLNQAPWGKYAWAQQVVWRNGTFYMYFPAQIPGNDVGIATSTSPTGPFTDALGHGIAPGDDPTAFIDTDGQAYLCSNNGGPFCGRLAPDMLGFETAQAMVTINGLGDGWFEAPWLNKINSTYYLTFMTQTSIGMYGYSLGWATNDSPDPLSPYTYRGLLQWSTPYDCGKGNASLCPESGGDNNHQGIAEFPEKSGKYWLAYHNRKLAVERDQYLGFQRNVALDRMYIQTDGTLVPVTSTPNWVRQLQFVNPYTAQPAALMAEASFGLDTEPATGGSLSFPRDVGNITRGSWIKVQGLDFGSAPGATNLTVQVATPVDGGVVMVALDSLSGPIIASIAVPNTGDWQVYTNETINIIPGVATGVHDVWFIFNGTGSTGLFNFLSWQFHGGSVSGAIPPPLFITLSFQAKGTGLFVSDPSAGVSPLVANASHVTVSETFHLIDNEDGSYSIQSNASGRWVCSSANGTGPLIASAASPSELCAQFRLQGTTEGSYVISALPSHLLVVAGPSGSLPLIPNATDPRVVPNDGARFWLDVAAIDRNTPRATS